MTIDAGQMLLHFRLVDKIGEGGMGVVWRAVDTTLDRDVAIKILPEGFAADADRLVRFEREAKLLASLSHANIASIHSVHRHQGLEFLAMEFVEGEDLAERLARGPLAVEDAVEMAIQVARGLEEAHEQGVIHRDLKPANIKRGPDGKIKVLDFGLAKALDPGATSQVASSPSMSPTMTSAGTVAGMILGTAAYMSPEQAKGRPVDRRADIWAFGVVLYESLTGKRLFQGETISETLAAVLLGATDWNALPEATPRGLRRLLERCLERDPRQRLRDIGEARIALERLGEEEPEGAAVEAAHPTTLRRVLPWAVAGLLVGAAASAVFFGGSSDAPQQDPSYLSVSVAPAQRVVGKSVQTRDPFALSPDGRTIAFIGTTPGESGTARQLVIRQLDQPEGIAVPDTAWADAPFFSPDGGTVGFVNRGTLRRVSVEGGPADALLESEEIASVFTAGWDRRVGIVFAGRNTTSNAQGLFRVDPDGSNLEALLVVEATKLRESVGMPSVLPGGKGILFNREQGGDYGRATVELFSIEDRETRVLARGLTPRFVATGHVVFAREGKLFALPFDPDSLATTGPPQVVMEGLPVDGISGESFFAVSGRGDLAYLSGSGALADRPNLLWVAADGSSIPVDAPGRPYADPRLSPDGTKVAFGVPSDVNDVWVHDLARRTQTRLTFAEGEDETPFWSPDGVWLAFSSSRNDERRTIRRRRADGSGTEELLWEGDEHIHVNGWTPDGKTLIVDADTDETGPDIWALDVEGDHAVRTLLGNPYREFHASLSPDGKWLAYTSNESERAEVYVQRFPELDRKIQISNDGGAQPRWSRDGRKLFYRTRSRMLVVERTPGAANPFSRPELLFEKEYGLGKAFNHFGYDIAANGQFLMTLPESESFPQRIDLVLDWGRELKDRFAN